MEIVPAKKLSATVSGVFKAGGKDFLSEPTDALELTYGGIKDDFHEGLTRKSGGREPWYARGTEMKNERQVSILSIEELEDIRVAMGLEKLDPGWIGASLVLEGIPNMSYLPARTLLFFDGGVTLRVDGYNAPCRLAGGAIAKAVGIEAEDHTKTDMALSFKEAGHMRRGLVAWVEREGVIRAGEGLTARIWPQWIYE